MSDTSSTDHGAIHDPVAADIDERKAETGDIVAGEQVLDEGKVSPSQDEVGEHESATTTDEATTPNVDDPESTSKQRENAAEERTDAGAAPIQPEAS